MQKSQDSRRNIYYLFAFLTLDIANKQGLSRFVRIHRIDFNFSLIISYSFR